MGGGGSKSQVVGYKYYLTLLMGICRGPINRLREVRCGDRTVLTWRYTGSSFTPQVPIQATDDDTFLIEQSSLFGGDKKEGGLSGRAEIMMGKPWQVLPGWLRNLIGGYSGESRGVVTFVYDGQISANSPYPKEWSFRVGRWNAGWDGAVWNPDNVLIQMGKDSDIMAMNPAHIIFECCTNKEWGRGLLRSDIDEISFAKAAEVLKGESFGLCLGWRTSDSLDEFVSTIIDHIAGSLYTDRATGLLTLKLMRNDYDPNEIDMFDYSSGLLGVTANDNGSREMMVNEVIVKFKDPVSNTVGQVRAQNLASIQSLDGSINSTTSEYPGLPTADLAFKVAQRDLRVQTAGLIRYSIRLDRRAWHIYPGAVFKIRDPFRNVDSLTLRAGKITDTTMTDGVITVDAMIDIFGLPNASYSVPETPTWEPPDTTARPVTRRVATEATYRDLLMVETDFTKFSRNSGAIAFTGARPSNLSISYVPSVQQVYQGKFTDFSTEAFAPSFTLAARVGPYDTQITMSNMADPDNFQAGKLLLLGSELMCIDEYTFGSPVIKVTRACLDTTPREHLPGEWGFGWDDFIGSDLNEYARYNYAWLKMLTQTTTELLMTQDAPVDPIFIKSRWAMPYAPGNLRLNGTPAFNAGSLSDKIRITWSDRNRLTQQDILVGGLETGSFAPEPGTTYTARLRHANGATIARVTVAAGAGFAEIIAARSGNLFLEFAAGCNGLESWQRWRVPVAYDTSVPTPDPTKFPGRRVGLVGDSITWHNTSYFGSTPPYYANTMVGYFQMANALIGQALKLEIAQEPDPSYHNYRNGSNFGIAASRTANWWDDNFIPDYTNGLSQRGPMHAALDYADNFDIVVTLGGTNDIAGNLSADSIVANMKRVCTTFTAVGKWVFLLTVFPRSASLLDGYEFDEIANLMARIKEVNTKLRAWIATENPANVWLVDCWDDLVGPNGVDPHGWVSNTEIPAGDDTVGNWKPGVPRVQFMGDGLHPSVAGAYLIGKKLAAAMTAAGVPPTTQPPPYPLIRGSNLLPNPNWIVGGAPDPGTTKPPTPGFLKAGTGSLPDRWMLFRSNNEGTDGSYSNFNFYQFSSFVNQGFPWLAEWLHDSTWADSAVTVNPVVLGDGRRALRLVVNIPVTGNRNESIVLRTQIPERPGLPNNYDQDFMNTPTPYNPGDWLEAGAEIHLDNIANLWCCKIQTDFLCVDGNDPTTYTAKLSQMAMGQNVSIGTIPYQKFYPEAQKLHIKAPAVQAPTPSAKESLVYNYWNLHLSLDASESPASVTIDIVDPYFRVAAPRPVDPLNPGGGAGYGYAYGVSYG